MADARFTGSGLIFSRKPWCLILICIFAVPFTACATKHTATTPNITDQAAVGSIRFFQHVISRVDGDRCNMIPSCSQYAVEAISKHGVLIGWIMTCDRLIRCGRDEVQRSPMVIRGDETYCVDSLENNDFWWYHRQP